MARDRSRGRPARGGEDGQTGEPRDDHRNQDSSDEAGYVKVHGFELEHNLAPRIAP
jgi:hypothetical protein